MRCVITRRPAPLGSAGTCRSMWRGERGRLHHRLADGHSLLDDLHRLGVIDVERAALVEELLAVRRDVRHLEVNAADLRAVVKPREEDVVTRAEDVCPGEFPKGLGVDLEVVGHLWLGAGPACGG